jgi:hypothetical protein
MAGSRGSRDGRGERDSLLREEEGEEEEGEEDGDEEEGDVAESQATATEEAKVDLQGATCEEADEDDVPSEMDFSECESFKVYFLDFCSYLHLKI